MRTNGIRFGKSQPWPIIARFLSSIPPNSIGLDSGAGNGKYLPVLRDGSRGSWMIALDRSEGLLSIAKEQQQEGGQKVAGGEECVRGDLGFEGWRAGVFVSTCHIRIEMAFNMSSRVTIRTLPSPSRLYIISPPLPDGYTRSKLS